MSTALKRELQNEKNQNGASTALKRNAMFLEANFGKCTTIKRNARLKSRVGAGAYGGLTFEVFRD